MKNVANIDWREVPNLSLMTKRQLTAYVESLAIEFEAICRLHSRMPEEVYKSRGFFGGTFGFRMEEPVFVACQEMHRANDALGALCG